MTLPWRAWPATFDDAVDVVAPPFGFPRRGRRRSGRARRSPRRRVQGKSGPRRRRLRGDVRGVRGAARVVEVVAKVFARAGDGGRLGRLDRSYTFTVKSVGANHSLTSLLSDGNQYAASLPVMRRHAQQMRVDRRRVPGAHRRAQRRERAATGPLMCVSPSPTVQSSRTCRRSSSRCRPAPFSWRRRTRRRGFKLFPKRRDYSRRCAGRTRDESPRWRSSRGGLGVQRRGSHPRAAAASANAAAKRRSATVRVRRPDDRRRLGEGGRGDASGDLPGRRLARGGTRPLLPGVPPNVGGGPDASASRWRAASSAPAVRARAPAGELADRASGRVGQVGRGDKHRRLLLRCGCERAQRSCGCAAGTRRRGCCEARRRICRSLPCRGSWSSRRGVARAAPATRPDLVQNHLLRGRVEGALLGDAVGVFVRGAPSHSRAGVHAADVARSVARRARFAPRGAAAAVDAEPAAPRRPTGRRGGGRGSPRCARAACARRDRVAPLLLPADLGTTPRPSSRRAPLCSRFHTARTLRRTRDDDAARARARRRSWRSAGSLRASVRAVRTRPG